MAVDDSDERWPDADRRRLRAPEGWEAIEIGGRHASRVGYRGGEIWMERTWRSPRGKVVHGVLAVLALLWAAAGVGLLAEWDWTPREPSRTYDFVARRNIRRDNPSISGAGVVGIVLGSLGFYISLARALNRTRIEVREGWLLVRHSPIPWRGVRHLDRADIEQIHCEKLARFETYSVHVKRRGKEKPLVVCEDLPTWKEALFVERRLERALGITDRKVDGEMLEKRLTTD